MTRFNYQFCDSDCVPITILNALLAVAGNDSLPSGLVHDVWRLSLDKSRRATGGSFLETSGRAVARLAAHIKSSPRRIGRTQWQFDVLHYRGPKVNLEELARKNLSEHSFVCLRTVWAADGKKGSNAHFLLLLKRVGDWFYFFDPILFGETDAGCVPPPQDWHFRDSRGCGWNLKVHRSLLNSEEFKHYAMGPLSRRTALVVRRTEETSVETKS